MSSPESPLHTSGYSNEPTGLGDERDDKSGATFPAEIVDAGLDSDKASDFNPGGLTFEEGLSLRLCLQNEMSLICDR